MDTRKAVEKYSGKSAQQVEEILTAALEDAIRNMDPYQKQAGLQDWAAQIAVMAVDYISKDAELFDRLVSGILDQIKNRL